MSQTPRSKNILAWTILLSLTLIWGSSFYLMKKGLEGFPPLEMAAIRLSTAALCLAPFWFRYFTQTTRREWALLFFAGLVGNGIPAFLFGLAETVIPGAVAGILNSLSPVFVVIMSWLVFGVRFPASRVLGVGIGLAGALLIITAGMDAQEFQTSVFYSLLIVIATVLYAINANLVKYKLNHLHPLHISSYAVGMMGIPYLVWLLTASSFLETLHSPAEKWASPFVHILILGAVGTAFSVVIFNQLLRLKDVVFSSSVTYMMPIVSVAWGLGTRESLLPMHVVGMGVIAVGVYLTNRVQKR